MLVVVVTYVYRFCSDGSIDGGSSNTLLVLGSPTISSNPTMYVHNNTATAVINSYLLQFPGGHLRPYSVYSLLGLRQAVQSVYDNPRRTTRGAEKVITPEANAQQLLLLLLHLGKTATAV